MKAFTIIETPLGKIELLGSADTGVEIWQGDLPIELQNGMVVDKAIAVVLSIGIVNSNSDIVFSAQLQNDEIKGYPETGEYLDCITWETNEWALPIGTEDKEALEHRLPNLITKEMQNPITYSTSGIGVNLPMVKTEFPITFHFIIAFKKLPDNRECSTWFSVDVPHKVAKKRVYENARKSAAHR
jgi:hypothetical protein